VELKRLKPARIFVVGGPTAVPEAIRADLAAYTAGPVTRLAGGDRYETAAAVSAAVYGQSNVVYLATGRDFPDALAGSALGGPLLLVPGSSIPAAVLAEVVRLRPLRIVVLGSPAAVADAPANALRAALGG
ncbi:MAG: cell wall-binding repeat-containing protein, partial [Candidatus Limnocylindrales bacterium]